MQTLIGVIGSSTADRAVLNASYETGAEIARAGFSLICGGLGGVMEAACRGAYENTAPESGRIIGVLPGYDRNEANPYVHIVIASGIGYARNSIIASSADAVIAISGGSGTLSEIALSWQYGKPVIILSGMPGFTAQLIDAALDERRSDRILGAATPLEAVSLAAEALRSQTA
jgi:uncharacterized protein (TIGR00725 family)